MTQTPHEARRERIARIIDPSSWRVLDSYLAEVKRKYAGQDAAYDPDSFKDKASLAKADAILADDPALVLVEMAKKALIEALALYDVATQAATFTRPRTGQVIVNVKRAETVMAQLRPAIVALAAYQSTDKGDAE